MEVLVTGANGQLAKTFKSIFERNKSNINFDFLSRNELDVSDTLNVTKRFSRKHYDYCLNFAAYTNVDDAELEREKAFKINAEGPRNLALSCKETKTILIHISTDYVFDGEGSQPYKINDKVGPINVYGESKLKGEKYIQENLEEYFIIRASWLYSANGNNFVKTIVRKIKENAPLKIVSSQKGTPTSCTDLSIFIFNLLTSGSNNFGIFHFSAIGRTDWYNFALQIASNFPGYDNNLISPVDKYETKAKRPRFSVMDIEKTSNIFNFKHWRESVDQVVQQLKTYN